jgi:hypothetical protein
MYRRFLNNNDYLGIITEQALKQLTRDDETRFEQAEQAAEASILDYLTDNYEVEKELDKGKYLFEYTRQITYPIGSHFYLDGKICEVIRAINGYRVPELKPYWEECEDAVDENTLPVYSQMLNYRPGDTVCHNRRAYRCVKENGYDFGDIRIPGVQAWQHVEAEEWQPVPYGEWDVARYDGKVFTLCTLEGYDELVDPMTSDNWGLIMEYDSGIDTYELSEHEYVVYKGEVFYPLTNPNAGTPELHDNIRYSDPRNYNLKRHMVQLALYELHKLISPNNISVARLNDYEASLRWLKDAGRLKINPQIPRKTDNRNEPVTDWQLATFQTEYNPYTNPWHV